MRLFDDPTLPAYAIHDEMFWAFNFTGKGLVKGDWKISSVHSSERVPKASPCAWPKSLHVLIREADRASS